MPICECPDRNRLSEYVAGTLGEALAREVAVHVEKCPLCAAALLRLNPAETAIGTPPGSVGSTSANQLESDPVPQRLREYRLLEKLGEGGMGAVYKAHHERLDKIVAIKVLPSARLRSQEAVARFDREMKAIGRLEHPNVIRAYDAGEVEGIHFLVMEYLEGADLSLVVRRAGPLNVADACEVIRQSAVGLEYAHQQGLVHRDVKPSNLMLTTAGQVKLLDLGLARVSHQSVPSAAELTDTGQMMGTFDYMAPEQVIDTHRVDIRADVYSLGATLYKLLCGVVPFAGLTFNTPMKKMLALSTQEPLPLAERRADLPPPLAVLVHWMLAKAPESRPMAPRVVAEALASFTTGHDLKQLVAKAHCHDRTIDHVTMGPTMMDLPVSDQRVSPVTLTSVVAQLFERFPHVVGVIVEDESGLHGVVSRLNLLERLSRPFALELYLKQPIQQLPGVIDPDPDIFSVRSNIHDAAHTALNRPISRLYDPVLIEGHDGKLRLLDVRALLAAVVRSTS
jgi:serine/threonine protein kinase